MCDFAKYPVTIYSIVVQACVTILLPYAFISFFPAAFIFEKGDLAMWGLLAPLVAVYCVGLALVIFRAGLRRYESTGN